jgi:hypothetical protein
MELRDCRNCSVSLGVHTCTMQINILNQNLVLACKKFPCVQICSLVKSVLSQSRKSTVIGLLVDSILGAQSPLFAVSPCAPIFAE